MRGLKVVHFDPCALSFLQWTEEFGAVSAQSVLRGDGCPCAGCTEVSQVQILIILDMQLGSVKFRVTHRTVKTTPNIKIANYIHGCVRSTR